MILEAISAALADALARSWRRALDRPAIPDDEEVEADASFD